MLCRSHVLSLCLLLHRDCVGVMVVRRRSPALQTHRQSEERMRTLFYSWLRRYFSDPQGVILIVLLVVGFGAVIFLGDMLAPVLASIVLAYLLEGLIRPLE